MSAKSPILKPKNVTKGLQVKQMKLRRAPISTGGAGGDPRTSINEGKGQEFGKEPGKGNRWAKKETKRKGINFAQPNVGGKHKKLRRAPSSQGAAV